MRSVITRAALCLIVAAPPGLMLGVLGCSEGTGSEDAGIACELGQGQMCDCPGGQTSVAWCRPDGTGFLPCECEAGDEGFADETAGEPGDGDGDPGGDGDGDPGGDGDGDPGDGDGDPGDGDGDPGGDGDGEDPGGDGDGDSGDGDGEPNLDEACYLGPNEDYAVCFPIAIPAPFPDGYDYPAPYQNNPNYRAPVRYLDLESIDASAAVAPNFTLDELAQAWKGRYAVVQPHAVERLQALRDIVGPIVVNSGYRPPGYNASIGGATSSRHMYGDGFDLDPVNVALSTLETACTQNAGFLVEYETHVHCDWRFTDVDVGFYGLPAVFDPQLDYPALGAELEQDPETGRWLAPATGFDEGEPLRRWAAYDEQGRLLLEARGRSFAAPAAATRIEVLVGAQVRLSSR